MPFSSDDRRIQIRRVRKNGKHTVSGTVRRRTADRFRMYCLALKRLRFLLYAFGRLDRQSIRLDIFRPFFLIDKYRRFSIE